MFAPQVGSTEAELGKPVAAGSGVGSRSPLCKRWETLGTNGSGLASHEALSAASSEMPAAVEEYCVIVGMAAINTLLARTLWPSCSESTVATEQQMKLGPAIKLAPKCSSCGFINS